MPDDLYPVACTSCSWQGHHQLQDGAIQGARCPECGSSVIRSAYRRVTVVGWDGNSNAMLRYSDEMDRPDHMRSIVSVADRERITDKPKPLGMPYWRAVPGGRKCPNCGVVIPVAGTKLTQAVHDHWATHDTDKEG